MPAQPLAITSLQNDRIKLIRSLEMRKARKETGLFVAEGASILITARDQGHRPSVLVRLGGEGVQTPILADLVAWADAAGATIIEVTPAVMAKIAAKDNPQTLMGVFPQRWGELPAVVSLASGDVWVALEEVRDPGNLGTIIRTVDAVGARGVILVGPCCDPYSRECVRATMGSIFSVPIVKTDLAGFLAWRGDWPGDVVGTQLDARDDFRKVEMKAPVLLVMGSEGPGMSTAVRGACSRLVVIPMAGRLDSLNLAVATALTLYQIRGAALGVRN